MEAEIAVKVVERILTNSEGPELELLTYIGTLWLQSATVTNRNASTNHITGPADYIATEVITQHEEFGNKRQEKWKQAEKYTRRLVVCHKEDPAIGRELWVRATGLTGIIACTGTKPRSNTARTGAEYLRRSTHHQVPVAQKSTSDQ